jgi:hypothetical protein
MLHHDGLAARRLYWETYNACYGIVSCFQTVLCARIELTCMDFLPTRQMLCQHEVASSLLLLTVRLRRRAWPIMWTTSNSDETLMELAAYLSSWEVVASGERGRVLVQRWFAIFIFCIVWKMWETEKTRLFWLSLLLEVFGVHFQATKIDPVVNMATRWVCAGESRQVSRAGRLAGRKIWYPETKIVTIANSYRVYPGTPGTGALADAARSSMARAVYGARIDVQVGRMVMPLSVLSGAQGLSTRWLLSINADQ